MRKALMGINDGLFMERFEREWSLVTAAVEPIDPDFLRPGEWAVLVGWLERGDVASARSVGRRVQRRAIVGNQPGFERWGRLRRRHSEPWSVRKARRVAARDAEARTLPAVRARDVSGFQSENVVRLNDRLAPAGEGGPELMFLSAARWRSDSWQSM